MYTNEQFSQDVAASFAFLESDYGMRRHPIHIAGAGAWIAYENADVKVVVEHEGVGYCGVSVQDLRHVSRDSLERTEFDLEEILKLSGVREPRRQDSPKNMTAVVARAADQLRTSCAAVLKGDFSTLHARQFKYVEAVRKNSPKITN
jgi:hypothetical protein